jgi:TonB family protein
VRKSVEPVFAQDVTAIDVQGVVAVCIVVDKEGNVSSAKAISGPSQLARASEEAARQWEFEPPKDAPVTTKLEMSYGLAPAPCPVGKNGEQPQVSYVEKLPINSGHPGELRIVSNINVPLPPYPQKAIEAGTEGDLELFITVTSNGEVIGVRVMKPLDPVIDNSAVATVRTWKFKVTRGLDAGFPIKFHYRLSCSGEQ